MKRGWTRCADRISIARICVICDPCNSIPASRLCVRSLRRIDMTELRFQPVVSWPIVVVVAVVLVGLLWVRPRHVQLAMRQWAALVGLRLWSCC